MFSTTSAEVLTKSIISEPFALSRGTCQGCPLSPLLFVLGIESLAIAVRTHSQIRGITSGGIENRLALYADDIVLFVRNLVVPLPALLKLIKDFDVFSGYKVNRSKYNILFLKESERLNPPVHTDFSPEGFKYLGINITPEIEDLVPATYNPIIASVIDSINRWTLLPLSLIGHINIIKKNILPKFLYLFQSLPLNPHLHSFPK